MYFLNGYFKTVWPPFFAYLSIYLLAWAFRIPVSEVTVFFLLLHLLHAILLLVFVVHCLRNGEIKWPHLLFWFMVAMSLLLPGVYLEYPSDPWEHCRRILSWQNVRIIAEGETKDKFAYFFGWTLVSWVRLEMRRAALGVTSAFWQMVLVLQFFVLLRSFRLEVRTAFIGVVGFLAFFGTGLFGIRYYSLSSTPLALTGLYGALVVVQESTRLGLRRLFWLAPLILLMELNHPKQELANFFIAGGALGALGLWSKFSAHWKQRSLFLFVGFGVVSIAYGVLVNWIMPAWYLSIKNAFSLTFFGTLSFTGIDLRILSTLGIHGVLGFLVAICMWRRYPELAILTIVPILVLLCPSTLHLLIRAMGVEEAGSLYRILYAFPATVILCVGLYERGGAFLSTRGFRSAPLFGGAILGLIIFGLIYNAPFYGRLYFQLFKPSNEQALLRLDETALWFAENRKKAILESRCKIIGDEASYFVLATHLGLPLYQTARTNPWSDLALWVENRTPVEFLTNRNACGVLIPIAALLPNVEESYIGRVSGHWNPRLSDLRYYLPPTFLDRIDILLSAGWVGTRVPPFYLYFEPPHR